jgi:hypothetical protein
LHAKTGKIGSQSPVFELFLNVLVQPSMDVGAKSLRLNTYILQEQTFFPHSVAF